MKINLALTAAACVLLLPTCQAQFTGPCTDNIVKPSSDQAVTLLQAANALTDEAARLKGRQQAHFTFSRAMIEGTTLATCLGPADVAKGLASALELRRVDKQVGASSGGAGSTSLVSSGAVPALLGLATEYGGITEAFSGTTATFRTTPAKLIESMAKAYGPDATHPSDRTLWALEHLSLAISFDTSRTDSAGTKTGSTLQANYQQLSQASARFILWNDRDPLAARNWQAILKMSCDTASQNLAEKSRELYGALSRITALGDAQDKAMKAYDALLITSPTPDASALRSIFTSYLKDARELTKQIPDWNERVTRYGVARLKSEDEHKKLYKSISKAPSLTFEYALNRPPVVKASATTAATTPTTTAPAVAAPDLSSGTLIFVASLLDSEYTINAKVNFFNETRPGMRGNFRDAQVSGKWDIPLGGISGFISKGTLTFSGLYEHLHQKPLGISLSINDQTVNQPGNMGIFQAKYSIPVGDSGVQIPISFTASNRTELIKEKDMRGNIGVTFDLDKLFVRK